jgi:hypothetical protein
VVLILIDLDLKIYLNEKRKRKEKKETYMCRGWRPAKLACSSFPRADGPS